MENNTHDRSGCRSFLCSKVTHLPITASLPPLDRHRYTKYLLGMLFVLFRSCVEGRSDAQLRDTPCECEDVEPVLTHDRRQSRDRPLRTRGGLETMTIRHPAAASVRSVRPCRPKTPAIRTASQDLIPRGGPLHGSSLSGFTSSRARALGGGPGLFSCCPPRTAVRRRSASAFLSPSGAEAAALRVPLIPIFRREWFQPMSTGRADPGRMGRCPVVLRRRWTKSR
jgi:hypothetical protein